MDEKSGKSDLMKDAERKSLDAFRTAIDQTAQRMGHEMPEHLLEASKAVEDTVGRLFAIYIGVAIGMLKANGLDKATIHAFIDSCLFGTPSL